MPWSKIRFSPGIVKNVTRYSADGTWVDGSLVRFRDGFPERWAGWVRGLDTLTFDGMCRSLHRWAVLNGIVYTGIGTNVRFYVAQDELWYDVTPIAETVVLANPLATTIGSKVITVTDTSHGKFAGDAVIISGAAAIGGIPAGDINKEHTVLAYVNDNQYTIQVATTATSTVAAGGGATVTFNYLYRAGGTDQSLVGGGWGGGPWGSGPWGGSIGGSDRLGVWVQDNWGEDLIACAMDGPIFYWDATAPSSRMVNIRNLPGADGNAPQFARFIAVSHRDRHLLAFGVSNEFGGSTYSPMTVRWCSQENILNWDEADTAGTAGSIPLSRGSYLIAVEATQREFLLWSDAAIYSLQFVGAPDVYVAEMIADYSDIAGLNAATTFANTTFWIGRGGFYAYDGRVQKMNSTVWEYIRTDINWSQSQKIFASTNRAQDEVIWFYPSVAGLECDKYVSYDIVNNAWTIGSLARTAWLDASFQFTPFAASVDHKLYHQDFGLDDGSENPPLPLNAYIESAPFELSSEGSFDKGDRFAFLRRILPDVTFPEVDGSNPPQMRIVLKTMDKPGGGFGPQSSSQVTQTAIIPVEQFTQEAYVRLRGRSITVRLESDSRGSLWRQGTMRLDMRTDGQR